MRVIATFKVLSACLCTPRYPSVWTYPCVLYSSKWRCSQPMVLENSYIQILQSAEGKRLPPVLGVYCAIIWVEAAYRVSNKRIHNDLMRLIFLNPMAIVLINLVWILTSMELKSVYGAWILKPTKLISARILVSRWNTLLWCGRLKWNLRTGFDFIYSSTAPIVLFVNPIKLNSNFNSV